MTPLIQNLRLFLQNKTGLDDFPGISSPEMNCMAAVQFPQSKVTHITGYTLHYCVNGCQY